jgi:hypothetical protein
MELCDEVQHLLQETHSYVWNFLEWRSKKFDNSAKVLNMILCNVMVVPQSWNLFCSTHSTKLTIATLVVVRSK